MVGWKKIPVLVRGINGHKEERELEFPEFWSENAANIAGAKYFRGRIGSDTRETSAREMISRVATTITGWGRASSYFDTDEEKALFCDELTYILLHQKAAFDRMVSTESVYGMRALHSQDRSTRRHRLVRRLKFVLWNIA